tara:strand:- start:40 stop:210 length:171 start_codon:yes stop_codon:yes gene_type:complete
MKQTYLVSCEEIRTFIVEVEAEDENEARELVNEDVNKYELVQELVSDWSVDSVEVV